MRAELRLLTSAAAILELILLSGFGFRHSSVRSGSVHGKIENVEIAGITRGFCGVFRFERFAENERNHFLVASAVGTEAACERFQIVILRRATEDKIAT